MKKYHPVQYELLRPGEVRSIQEKCPVIYIPIGVLEWHGVQNPLGTDGLKAHAICCDAALRYGGVVLPPQYLGILNRFGERGWGPKGWDGYGITSHDQASLEDTIYRLASGLVANEWKVLAGVTGHDVPQQRNALHDGIQRACNGTSAKGFGVFECENWEGDEALPVRGDHAGSWETSTMMYAHEDRVSLDELRKQMTATGREDQQTMQIPEPEGIGGVNPLKEGSSELGQRIVEFCGKRIGSKAMEVLAGRLEPEERASGTFLDSFAPTE